MVQFTDKIASIWDEASQGFDSLQTSSLFRIEPGTFVEGSFEGSDSFDYYQLDIPPGTYVLFVSTEGLNPSSVLAGSFDADIVNTFGLVQFDADLSRPDNFTEQITFTYTGEADLSLKLTTYVTSDFTYRAAIYPVDTPPPPPPSEPSEADQWQLLAGDGQFASIGGYGQVFGTQSFQAISVLDLPGTVTFDPSFNRGNNLVFLNGDAGEWQATVRGSSALLSDGDTFVLIPVGTAGLHLDFDDGQRTLRFDSDAQKVMIGSQALGDDYAVIIAPEQTLPFPSGYIEDSSGRLLLASGAELVAGGNLEVFGTSGNEDITLLLGDFRFDPSFNRGGDTIRFAGDAEQFEGSLVGSSVLIANEEMSALIPVGTNGSTLSFFDAEGLLAYDTGVGAVLLGYQTITASPTVIAFG